MMKAIVIITGIIILTVVLSLAYKRDEIPDWENLPDDGNGCREDK